MFSPRDSFFSLALAVTGAALMTASGCSSTSDQRSEDISESEMTHETSSAQQDGRATRTADRDYEPTDRDANRDGLMQRMLPDSPLDGSRTRTRDGMTVSTMAFPTGRRATSAVLVEKAMPAQVNRGQAFEYTISVSNISDLTLDDVTLADAFSGDFDFDSSSPSPGGDSSGDDYVWDLGTMEPGETKTITVRGSAESTGSLGACGNISYDSSVCVMTEVVEPALQLAKTATGRVLECDAITYTYTVTNDGSGTATGVVIRDRLPRGVTLAGGGSLVEINVGDLMPGQSRQFTAQAKASRTGEFSSQATASASPELEAESDEPETTVVKPELAVSIDCPDRQYIGRNSTYEIEVENTGNGEARNATIVATLPAGAAFVSASEGGVRSGNRVTWDLRTLNADASRDLAVTLRAANAGSNTLRASVSAYCAETASDECTVDYRGIPAILLEVVDETDPVEVGTQTTYIITATNQGSAPDTNVKIVCELPESLVYVSGAGTTNVTNRGRSVEMAPLASLGVGQEAVWRVTVRATEEADARFSVEMTTDRLTKPVRETEATNLYE